MINPVESLYIHWPFCPYKCHFCPFVALAGHEEYMERYHEILLLELENFSKSTIKTPIKTIFFGGGTPSTYPENLLLDTFGKLNKVLEIDKTCEITLEVNPGTVTQEKLDLWKQVGINRLSIGVQSLNNSVLKKLNRHQEAADVFMLMQWAENKFNALSVDLIIGLPGVSEQEWKNTIAQVVAWPIKHISIYFLTVHEDTPLYFGIKKQKIVLPCDETIVDLYYWTIEELARHGIYQYEISNFAKPGYECAHNQIYWYRKPYRGLGLGACSFDGSRRLQNEKNLLKYLQAIETASDATVFYETLSDKQVWLEKLMLGLRQIKGVLLEEVTQPLEPEQKQVFFQAVDMLSQEGFLLCQDNRLALSVRGLTVVNEIIVKLSCF